MAPSRRKWYDNDTVTSVLAGVIVTLVFAAIVAGIWAVLALALSWAWSTVVPIFWAGAPVLSFVQAAAIVFIVWFARVVVLGFTK